MSLSSEQRSYIVQNMSRMGDDQLARDLGVDEKLVSEFVATINDVVGHLKEEVKSYQLKYATLLVEFINNLDAGIVLTLPKTDSIDKRELIIESLINFVLACRSGQFADLLVEALKRESVIDDNYLNVYNRVRSFVEKMKNNEEILSPLSVFSRNTL